MIVLRSILTVAVFAIVITMAPRLEAQTASTLTVTARVVEECIVGVTSKRELVKLARRLNDPSIIRRCSEGVRSNVDQKVTRIATVTPAIRQPSDVSTKSSRRSVKFGEADVVLVTVSY